jgi:shikimate dehydrogenase
MERRVDAEKSMTIPSRYAVFGQPIAHSLSPCIHAMFAAQFGMMLDYRAIEAGHDEFPRKLTQFANDGGRGANVTLPLKQDALALCSYLTDRARRCGSVNTLARIENASGSDGWRGDSTDGAGFLRDLRARHAFDPEGRRCLLLGAGGAARAVAFALADANVAMLAITNRTAERAKDLATAIGDASRVAFIEWRTLDNVGTFDLVVHATSAGHDATRLEWPRSLIAPSTVCYDLSYGRAARAFLRAAREAGAARVADGLGLLVEQAAESFAIWHGRMPETTSVFDTLRREHPLEIVGT